MRLLSDASFRKPSRRPSGHGAWRTSFQFMFPSMSRIRMPASGHVSWKVRNGLRKVLKPVLQTHCSLSPGFDLGANDICDSSLGPWRCRCYRVSRLAATPLLVGAWIAITTFSKQVVRRGQMHTCSCWRSTAKHLSRLTWNWQFILLTQGCAETRCDFVWKGALTPCDVVDMFLKFVNKLKLPNLANSDIFRSQLQKGRPRAQTLIRNSATAHC